MFNKIINIRNNCPDAKELVDMYFFETVVRIHRMGEGEPYTGLKPAGYKPPEGIEAADKAIETGSLEYLLERVNEKFHVELKNYLTM